jgi:hypothetical protein
MYSLIRVGLQEEKIVINQMVMAGGAALVKGLILFVILTTKLAELSQELLACRIVRRANDIQKIIESGILRRIPDKNIFTRPNITQEGEGVDFLRVGHVQLLC